jgi:hypothetical protein
MARDMPASYACPYHHMWWVVFHRNRVVKTLFDPKTFKDRKLRKIANPSEKRTFPHNKHIVRNISHVSIAEFVCEYWLKLLHCQVLLRVARHGRTRYSACFRAELWGDGSCNSGTSHLSGYWPTAPRRIFHIPLRKYALFAWKKSYSARRWLPKHLLKWSIDLCCLFTHPQNPQWHKCQSL